MANTIDLDFDKKRILELEAKVIFLEATISKLFLVIDELNAKLAHKKNSRNSSLPPSKDENRPLKNQSLRPKSDKKEGGQLGHEGSTLKMTENPDQIIEHKPSFCTCCGSDLSDTPEVMLLKRQVVDIPPIFPQYTEHRTFKRTCTCGHKNESVFPQEIRASISYGANIQATVAYLHTRQYLPFERMREFFMDICQLPISQGTLVNILNSFALKAQPAYDLIAQNIAKQEVIGTDETGIKVNGKNNWFWTWQSRFSTYVVFSRNRGTATINTNFPEGFRHAVLVHDCWASHFQTACKTHQLCIAHLLRELIYLEEAYKSSWSIKLKLLLYKALELKRNLNQKQYKDQILERDQIEKELLFLLEEPLPEKQKKLRTFHKRMIKYQKYLLPFLYHFHVPPDNNASERAIRNVKVKQKISGQFKTECGAQIYAVIRSVTDTCIKNNQNVLIAFKTIAELRAE